jgi:hypothetical protein
VLCCGGVPLISRTVHDGLVLQPRADFTHQLQPCSGRVLWYLCTVSGCRSRNLRLHSHHCDSRRPTAHSRRSTLSALSRMQVECLRVRAAPRPLLPSALERGARSEMPRRKSSEKIEGWTLSAGDGDDDDSKIWTVRRSWRTPTVVSSRLVTSTSTCHAGGW